MTMPNHDPALLCVPYNQPLWETLFRQPSAKDLWGNTGFLAENFCEIVGVAKPQKAGEFFDRQAAGN